MLLLVSVPFPFVVMINGSCHITRFSFPFFQLLYYISLPWESTVALMIPTDLGAYYFECEECFCLILDEGAVQAARGRLLS